MTLSVVTFSCLALLAGALAETDGGSDGNQRIIGGKGATIEEFPFQVSLRANGIHFCGGAIISERHILTAAHCLHNGPARNSITVVTGSTTSYGSGGKAYRVSRLNIHSGYAGQWDNYRNDIAVITLSSQISFDKSTRKIQLPSRDVQTGATLTISGWGITNLATSNTATFLQKADTTVIANPTCSASLSRANAGITGVYKEQICTFQRVGLGACNGDSGGPLSANNEVVGLVSFGIPCARGYPDVFTRVYSYKSWIQNIMSST